MTDIAGWAPDQRFVELESWAPTQAALKRPILFVLIFGHIHIEKEPCFYRFWYFSPLGSVVCGVCLLKQSYPRSSRNLAVRGSVARERLPFLPQVFHFDPLPLSVNRSRSSCGHTVKALKGREGGWAGDDHPRWHTKINEIFLAGQVVGSPETSHIILLIPIAGIRPEQPGGCWLHHVPPPSSMSSLHIIIAGLSLARSHDVSLQPTARQVVFTRYKKACETNCRNKAYYVNTHSHPPSKNRILQSYLGLLAGSCLELSLAVLSLLTPLVPSLATTQNSHWHQRGSSLVNEGQTISSVHLQALRFTRRTPEPADGKYKLNGGKRVVDVQNRILPLRVFAQILFPLGVLAHVPYTYVRPSHQC
ncbi:hypothetical protein CCUS01_03195 [Colletotrichum cuscutae]|uniref:Uncharacterized protein n=1 Tax=Colletotrichum cuscutae TaxID=1209917 RepID=A0AAJ0DLY0_9PEZI|nr:hypothetical protein CCUS01_03195 [Colletotrichum cuscutae]